MQRRNKQEHYPSGINQANTSVVGKEVSGAIVSPCVDVTGVVADADAVTAQSAAGWRLHYCSSAGRSASKPVSYYPTRLPRSLNIHHKIAAQRGSSDAGRGFPSAPRVVNLRSLRLLQFTL